MARLKAARLPPCIRLQVDEQASCSCVTSMLAACSGHPTMCCYCLCCGEVHTAFEVRSLFRRQSAARHRRHQSRAMRALTASWASASVGRSQSNSESRHRAGSAARISRGNLMAYRWGSRSPLAKPMWSDTLYSLESDGIP